MRKSPSKAFPSFSLPGSAWSSHLLAVGALPTSLYSLPQLFLKARHFSQIAFLVKDVGDCSVEILSFWFYSMSKSVAMLFVSRVLYLECLLCDFHFAMLKMLYVLYTFYGHVACN